MLCRSLGLGAPHRPLCSATDALVGAVEDEGGDSDFLSFVEQEYGLVLAKARLEGERRKQVSAERRAEKELEAGREMGFLDYPEE